MALFHGASLEASAALFSSNIARRYGGGLAAFNSTVVKLGENVVFRTGSAGAGGGGLAVIQAAGGSSIFMPCDTGTLLHNNSAQNGGGAYLLSRLEVQEGGRLTVKSNLAQQNGGGLFSAGPTSQLHLAFNSHLLFEQNMAKAHGGGLALLDGAQLSIKEEGCDPTFCDSTWISDGVCHAECLSRGCRWDGGDCRDVFENAGSNARNSCDMGGSRCYANNPNAWTVGDCTQSCFLQGSTCDWALSMCSSEKASLASCPLFDLAAYKSMQVAESITYILEPAAIGFYPYGAYRYTRCNVSFDQCSAPSYTNLTRQPGPLGNAVNLSTTWVVLSPTEELSALGAQFSVELWVQLAAVAPYHERRYLLASSLIELFLTSSSTGDSLLSIIIKDNNSMPVPNCTATVAWPASGWAHLALLVGNSTVSLLRNASLMWESQACLRRWTAATGKPALFNDYGLALGRWAPGQADPCDESVLFCAPLGALVDQLRLWRRERYPAEVAANMMLHCSSLQDSAGELTACYDMAQVSGSLVADTAGPMFSNAHGVNWNSEKFMPWCYTMVGQNDDPAAPNWGHCARRPLLPGLGFNYNPKNVLALESLLSSKRSLAKLLASDLSACGTVPLSFVDNRAEGYGGAVYQDRCSETVSASEGSCFFSGTSTMTGEVLVRFIDNAAEVGGAVFTACDHLTDGCATAMQKAFGFPVPPWLPSKGWLQLLFEGNSAVAYGPDVATAPSQLVLPSPSGGGEWLHARGDTRVRWPSAGSGLLVTGSNQQLAYTPGQELLKLTVILLDGLGQLVRGTPRRPHPSVLM